MRSYLFHSDSHDQRDPLLTSYCFIRWESSHHKGNLLSHLVENDLITRGVNGLLGLADRGRAGDYLPYWIRTEVFRRLPADQIFCGNQGPKLRRTLAAKLPDSQHPLTPQLPRLNIHYELELRQTTTMGNTHPTMNGYIPRLQRRFNNIKGPWCPPTDRKSSINSPSQSHIHNGPCYPQSRHRWPRPHGCSARTPLLCPHSPRRSHRRFFSRAA